MKRVIPGVVAGVAAVIASALLLDGPADILPSPDAAPSTLPATAPPTAGETVAAEPTSSPTAQLLAALDVKGRAPKTDYDRAHFGPAWSDNVSVEGGHNGCDTRNDILRRDLTDVEIRPGTHGCVVTRGTLTDPYSGQVLDFVRGPRSSEVQIDHVVPLADAWQKGAQGWDEETRRNFANDPLNLLAVDGPLNQQKGAGDAATWLPPDRSFRCDYATRMVEVKSKYGLWVTAAEQEALARELQRCP